MKFEWEASDIRPPRRFSKAGIKEVCMLGYVVPAPGEDLNKFVAVSLSDGLVSMPARDAVGMAEVLNRNNYVPLEFLPPKEG